MRIPKVSILVFALAAILAALPCQAAEKKAFNYVMSWVGQLDPGIETHTNKTSHLRGQKNIFIIDASDDRLDGTMTTEANSNVDSTGSGVLWGTFQILDAYNVVIWEGTWQGQIYNYALGKLNFINKSVGHGVGKNEGLMYEDTQAFDTLSDLIYYPWQGYGVGEIKDTNKK